MKRIATIAPGTLLSSLLLAACADAPGTASPEAFQVTDSAGVEIVMNAAGEAPGELRVVEDLRIGSMDEARDELLFYNVRALLVDADGTIYVGNDQTATVRVFSADGTFLHEFGGRGEGPADIPRILNDMMWAGDSITVIDWQSGGKTLLFDTESGFVDSWRNRLADGTRTTPTGHTPLGWITAVTERDRPENPVPGVSYGGVTRMHPVDLETGEMGDPVVEFPGQALFGSPETEGLDWALFEATRAFDFDGRGNFYRSWGEEYRIDVWNADGRHVRSIRRAHEEIPITRADIDEVKVLLRELHDTISFYADDPARREQAYERTIERIDRQAGFPRPQTRPPLGRMLVSADGAIWVERHDHQSPAEAWVIRSYSGFDRTPRTETIWDLFTPEGRFRGNVTLPPRFSPMAVTEGAAIGVLKDELDVEYVVRYRVEGG
jgi:hypothetical protein